VTSRSWSFELDGVCLLSRTAAHTWEGPCPTPSSQAEEWSARAIIAATISRPAKKLGVLRQARHDFGHSTSTSLATVYGFARRQGRCRLPAARDHGAASMTRGPRSGDVLCSPVSDARFLVIEPGTAAGMPSLAGVVLSPGEPHPCSKAAEATGCDVEGGGRYFDPITELSLLCIWPGRGSLRYEDRELVPEHQAHDHAAKADIDSGSRRCERSRPASHAPGSARGSEHGRRRRPLSMNSGPIVFSLASAGVQHHPCLRCRPGGSSRTGPSAPQRPRGRPHASA